MKLSEHNEELFAGLAPGGIALDCGANVGDVTQKMAETGATVYAFEPDPHAFKVLQNRFKDASNVVCINKGVWHENSRLPLYFNLDADQDPVGLSYASSLFWHKLDVNPDHSVEIEVIDLPEFILNLKQPVQILKLDVEGAEFDILEKLIGRQLHRKIGLIVVETHELMIPHFAYKLNRLNNLIENEQITNIDLNWN